MDYPYPFPKSRKQSGKADFVASQKQKQSSTRLHRLISVFAQFAGICLVQVQLPSLRPRDKYFNTAVHPMASSYRSFIRI